MTGNGRKKALIAWSSGKDCAWALYQVRQSGAFDIVGALTTVTETFGRACMHEVCEEVLKAQLEAAGLPGVFVKIPFPCPNDVYEARMKHVLAEVRARGITHIIFGDLFLEDVRRYREAKLAGSGITPLFPLWGQPTSVLAREMIEGGLLAHLVCVDLKALPISFAGRKLDARLLDELPFGVDPCGEKGEFHTCVVAGPMFSRSLPVVVGETVERDGFAFTDITMKG